jgi:hypothetical protein
LKGGDEVGLLDQAVLSSQDPEKQVAVGFALGHGIGLRAGVSSGWCDGFGRCETVN